MIIRSEHSLGFRGCSTYEVTVSPPPQSYTPYVNSPATNRHDLLIDSQGTNEQKEYHQRILHRKVEYMQKHGLPIWNGEFGPVYANPSDGEDWDRVNGARYGVLEYQLSLYRQASISWSIWLWKGTQLATTPGGL